jgi:pimeloyl-ACP methyl ester carboxylesterase
MRTLHVSAPLPVPAAACIVLLAGAYQEPEDFLRAGFDCAIRERALNVELVLVAPELQHVADRSWLAELPGQVLQPLRAGTAALWLGGISLGAFMALRCAAGHPQLADGLCLIAPYLGSRILGAEIAAQGGLSAWRAGPLAEDDDERQVWRYLQSLSPPPPELYLGLGREDRFGDTQGLLARALPAALTVQRPGGHDWPVWRQLWDNFLDRHAARYAAQEAPSRPA